MHDAATAVFDASADAGTPDAADEAGIPDVFADAPTDQGYGDVDAADAASEGEANCMRICELGTTIGCGGNPATCVSRCVLDVTTRGCAAEKIAAQRCVIAAGTDAMVCMNDQAFVKPGYCEAEKGTLTTCLLGLGSDAGSD